MDNFLIGLAGGLLAAMSGLGGWWLARRRRRSAAPQRVTRESFITSMRAVGELSVFRIMTKEVISASDHWFGEFGRKYLSWLLSERRITLVIEFDVDFRYDLNDPQFTIETKGANSFELTLPPCRHEVLIRDMQIHSEDNTELLPLIMPEMIGRVFTGGFSVEAKNKLIAETRQQARGFAGELVAKATTDAQRSAAQTLSMLAQGLGAERADVHFLPGGEFAPEVDSSKLESILPAPDQIREGGF